MTFYLGIATAVPWGGSCAGSPFGPTVVRLMSPLPSGSSWYHSSQHHWYSTKRRDQTFVYLRCTCSYDTLWCNVIQGHCVYYQQSSSNHSKSLVTNTNKSIQYSTWKQSYMSLHGTNVIWIWNGHTHSGVESLVCLYLVYVKTRLIIFYRCRYLRE